MNIKGIIAISGKPGLFKVAAQGRNNIIVQSLDSGKKFPAFASDKISALEDICIYTYEEDVPLVEVYTKLAEKEGYKKSISHKEAPVKLREHIQTYLPDYDEERVYDQDLKKLYQWYNLLCDNGLVVKEEAEKEEKEEKPKAKATGEKAKPKAKAAGEKAKTKAKPKASATAKKTTKTEK